MWLLLLFLLLLFMSINEDRPLHVRILVLGDQAAIRYLKNVLVIDGQMMFHSFSIGAC